MQLFSSFLCIVATNDLKLKTYACTQAPNLKVRCMPQAEQTHEKHMAVNTNHNTLWWSTHVNRWRCSGGPSPRRTPA